MFGFTVYEVTPSGQVVVRGEDPTAREIRFDKDGYEMSKFASRYRRGQLIVDVANARERERKAEATRKAVDSVNAVRGDAGRYNDKESLQTQVVKLSELLDAARAAVEAI